MEEIEFAFRSSASLKDWGKSLNLGLIDEVMIPYLEQRRLVSKIEEQEQPKQLEENTEVTDDELLEYNLGTYRMMKNYPIINIRCYDVLISRKLIKVSIQEKKAIESAVNAKLADMVFRDPNLYKEIPYEERFLTLCKKLVVARYFDSLTI
ncbi:MAG: hypothetical protein NVSMB45_15090 [Ginsengibacter sp.]